MKEIKIDDKISLKEAIEGHKKIILNSTGGLFRQEDAPILVGMSFIFCTKDETIVKSGIYAEGLEDDEK